MSTQQLFNSMQPMTKDRLMQLLTYDRTCGEFISKCARNRVRIGQEVGTVFSRRRKIMLDGKLYLAHRLAWLYVHGEWPKGDIDHIDGNPLNNAIANLRDVSRSVNMQNLKHARVDSQTGLLGTFEKNGRFGACIKVNGKTKHLGAFKTPEDAHEAYLLAKREMHEGCTL